MAEETGTTSLAKELDQEDVADWGAKLVKAHS